MESLSFLTHGIKKKEKKNHKTTQPPLKYLATTGFYHRGYLEKTTMVNLYSKEQSLEASMIKPILWFFCSFS